MSEGDATESTLPLDGLLVVELSGGRGELCARLLADLGAQVVLVEPPEGVRSRRRGPWVDGESLYFAGRNAGKRSVVADLSTQAGRSTVLRLLGSADVLIESLGHDGLAAAGLDPVLLQQSYPQLVIASVSDFGVTGPYANFRGSEAVLGALGGILARSGLPGRAPVVPPGELATESAAVQAAWCVLLAYWNRLHLGVGDRLDISLHDSAAQVIDPGLGVTGTAASGASALALPRGRPGEGYRYPIIPCTDGHVRLCVLAPRQWHALRAWLGDPAELMDADFDKNECRQGRWDEIRPFIDRLFVTMTSVEIVEEGQRRGIPVDRLASPADVLEDKHFQARGAFSPLSVGSRSALAPAGFFEIDGTRIGAPNQVPGIGESTARLDAFVERDDAALEDAVAAHVPAADQSRRPLTGLRVIDLGVIVAGAELGRILANQGADVIKVENTEFPDAMRLRAWGTEMNPSFACGHRGKRSAGINLRSEMGRQVFLDLVAHADLVLSNFKPGTLEKLGLGPDVIAGVNPRVVLVDSSALGTTGPRAKSMGYGPLVRAVTSLTQQWRDPEADDGFCDTVTIFPDHFVARVCALGAMALLIRREHTASGGAVSVSQAESILNVMPEFFMAASLNNDVEADTTVDFVVPCAGDDEWCVVTLFDEADQSTMTKHLNNNGFDVEMGDSAGLEAALRSWAGGLAPRQVMGDLQGAGLAAGAMLRPTDYRTDPQFVARRFVVELEQPGLADPLMVENAPCISQRMPDPELIPAPYMFAHTREVARAVLGLGQVEIDALIAANALEVHPQLEAKRVDVG